MKALIHRISPAAGPKGMAWPTIFFIVVPALAYAVHRLLMQAWQTDRVLSFGFVVPSGHLLWLPRLPFGITYGMLVVLPILALIYWHARTRHRPVLQQLSAFALVQLPITVVLDIVADLLQRIDPYGPFASIARFTLYDIVIWLSVGWFAARASRPHYAPLILFLPMSLYIDARFSQGLVYQAFHYSYVIAVVGWFAVALLSAKTLVRYEGTGRIPVKFVATLIALGPLVFSLFHLTEFRIHTLPRFPYDRTTESELLVEFFASLFVTSWSQVVYIIVTGSFAIGLVWLLNKRTSPTDAHGIPAFNG